MGNGHASLIYQPSQSKRTLGCPGWGNLCKNVKPKPAGDYANEGTLAHDIAACCLSRKQDVFSFIGKTGYVNDEGGVAYEPMTNAVYSKVIDDEMVLYIKEYLDEVHRKKAATRNALSLIEQKISLEWLVPGMFGTGDHILIEPLSTLYINDLKFGAGVAVEIGDKVGDNPQLTTYALMAVGEHNEYMVGEVEATIIQPRAIHPHGSVRPIRYNVEELYEWGREVLLPGIKRAESPDAPLSAGDWCKWCPGDTVCPEIRRSMFEVAEIEADKNLDPVANPLLDPVKLDGPRLGRVLQFTDVLESWIKSVKEEGYRRLMEGGDDVPSHFKLVAGQLSNRAWVSPDDVPVTFQDILDRNAIYKPAEIRSPAQLEKALKRIGKGKKEIAKFIEPLLKERTPGKPIMVPVSDSRPALPPPAEKMFGEQGD